MDSLCSSALASIGQMSQLTHLELYYNECAGFVLDHFAAAFSNGKLQNLTNLRLFRCTFLSDTVSVHQTDKLKFD